MSDSPYRECKDDYSQEVERPLKLQEHDANTEARPLLKPQHNELELRHTTSWGDRSTSEPNTSIYGRIYRLSLNLFYALLPSFISHPQVHTSSPHDQHDQRLALAGLRGLSCMMVFHGHYFNLYLSRDALWYRHIPLIDILFEGGGAVPIFFIISGYVLSRRAVRLMRGRQTSDMLKAIASATIRRGPRLFLPCFAVAFLTMVLTAAGAYDKSKLINQRLKVVPKTLNSSAALPVLLHQYWLHVTWLVSAVYPFEIQLFHPEYFTYDGHQWSIPVEYYSSLAMFGTLVAVSQLQTLWRISLIFCAYSYFYLSGRQRITPFFTGLLIAEAEAAIQDYRRKQSLDLPTARPNSTLRPQIAPDDSRIGQALLRFLTSMSPRNVEILSVISMIMGVTMITSFHTEGNVSESPVHWIVKHLVWEPTFFLLYYGAMFVVVSAICSNYLQSVFTNAVSVYLGDISFGIYLVHGPIIRSVGYLILPATLGRAANLSGEDQIDAAWFASVSTGRACVGSLMGYVIVCPMVIWAADLFWRFIDIPSVKLIKRCEKAILQSQE